MDGDARSVNERAVVENVLEVDLEEDAVVFHHHVVTVAVAHTKYVTSDKTTRCRAQENSLVGIAQFLQIIPTNKK